MKIAVCAVIRMENLYVREWVEYYRDMGFDNVILYDNNADDEEKLSDIIDDYIKSGFVIVDDSFKYATNFQVKAYNNCIMKRADDFDWIIFLDLDEFLTFTQKTDVKQYLDKFEDVDEICFNWMMFDDNDLIYYDSRPVVERFTRPCPLGARYQHYTFSDNCHVKSFLHVSRNPKMRFGPHPHVAQYTTDIVMPDGSKKLNGSEPWVAEDTSAINYDVAYIRHYVMKTIDEFINRKLKKGAPDISKSRFKMRYNIGVFFKLNEKTPEKEKFIEDINNGRIKTI